MPIKRAYCGAIQNVVEKWARSLGNTNSSGNSSSSGNKKPSGRSNLGNAQSTVLTAIHHPRSKQRQYRSRKNDVKHKWSCFNTQAARRGINQHLTFEQCATLTALCCTYCGYRSTQSSTNLIGVDRIDSSRREYALPNCVPCCSKCNFMKGQLDHSTFLAQVRAIASWRTGVRFWNNKKA